MSHAINSKKSTADTAQRLMLKATCCNRLIAISKQALTCRAIALA